MTEIWNQQNFDASFTRTCFSWTPWDVWDAKWGNSGPALKDDPNMQRLLELEWQIRPVPVWVQKIVRQIESLPPCGSCFPQHVEAVCRNIGRQDPDSAITCSCYSAGPERLELLSDIAICLDAWLKGFAPKHAAAAILQLSAGGRNWAEITDELWRVLGEATTAKKLLIRRLLARLRFWLRAPYGRFKQDDNPRQGYFYCDGMSRYGGWDYFSFDDYDPEVAELRDAIKANIPNGDRWLELINYTWPCAPKAFRFLERIIFYTGNMTQASGSPPDEKAGVPDFLQITGTYLDSDASRRLYNAAAMSLREFVEDEFQPLVDMNLKADKWFASLLTEVLGSPTLEKTYLAALLLQRVLLFRESFKSFHFTRNVNHVF